MTAPPKSDRKALLKSWKSDQKVKARAGFPMADAKMAEFFQSVESLFEKNGCNKGPENAIVVMEQMGLDDEQSNRLLDWCGANGGYCDCEIVGNTFGYWEENRN